MQTETEQDIFNDEVTVQNQAASAPSTPPQTRDKGLWVCTFKQASVENEHKQKVNALVAPDPYRGNCILLLPNPKPKEQRGEKEPDWLPFLTRTLEYEKEAKDPMLRQLNGTFRKITHKNDGTPLPRPFLGGYWDRFNANINFLPPEKRRNPEEVAIMYISRPPQTNKAPQQPAPQHEGIPF